MTGDGVPKDKKKAVELLQASAGKGNATAMYNLGTSYMKGDGVSKDKKKATELYKRAADLGQKEAKKTLQRMKVK